MTQGRWRVSALAVLTLVAASWSGLDMARAQVVVPPPAAPQDSAPRLPSDVYGANPLTGDHLRLVDAFADRLVPQLLGRDGVTEEQVVSARFALMQPMSYPGVSEDFRTQYSVRVGERMKDALAPEQPLLNRLNAMIVASRLKLDANILNLILQGLQDESPAVRYWAVKALGGRPAGGLSGQQANALFTRLEEMLQREDALQVLRQVFQVLVEMPGVRGIELVVSALNRRVRAHIGDPMLPYDAELSGMQAAYQRLLRVQAEGQPVDQIMRELARAATQYLLLIAQQGQQNAEQIQGPLADSYLRMASLSHQVLTQAQQQFGGNPLPPIPGNQLNWQQIMNAAQAARNLMINPPFNFDPADVTPQVQ